MTPKEEKELGEHIEAIARSAPAKLIAKILYRQAQPEQIETLAKIEETVREQTLEHISPRIGFFLSNKLPELQQVEADI